VQSLLFLGINLVSLVLFSAVAFRANEVNLLHGLDGAYVMTIVRQQALWGSGPLLALTSNPLQSLGNVWFGLKTTLMPEYALPLIWTHGDPAPVAYFTIFAAEAFLSAYLLGLCLGRGAGVAAVAGWVFVLTALPYFGLPKIYPILALSPQLTTIRLLLVLVFLLFGVVGRVGAGGSVLCLAGAWVLVVYMCISQPTISVLELPIIIAAAAALILAAESTQERWMKIAGGVLVVTFLLALGLPQFLYGLYRYTAAYVFRAELLNARQSWYFVSIVFQGRSWGMAGPILYTLAAAGGGAFAAAGRGLARLFAITMLATMALLLAFGALTIFVNFWQGPSPVYFEIFLWPFYAAYAVGFLHLLGVQLARLARRIAPVVINRSAPAGARIAGIVCLSCAGFPWILLGVYHPFDGLKERNYPFPPQLTPIAKALQGEVGLRPGDRFRGRVATLTGQSLSGPATWFDLTGFDNEVLRHFRNDHRTVGLWYYNVPTLFEYSPHITPPFYLIARAFLAGHRDRQMRSVMALRNPDGRILRALGVRFVIVDVPAVALGDARLRLRMSGSPPLLLYELQGSNLGTYSPVNVLMVRSSRSALVEMSRADFDPRRDVVVTDTLPGKLVPITSSTITVATDGLHISARSRGKSLLLLPFEYSRCLDVKQETIGGIQARVLRANLVETGLLFDQQVEATLTYVTGLLHHSSCRIDDSRDVDALGMGHEVRQDSAPTISPR
jgi:hypothetical protein